MWDYLFDFLNSIDVQIDVPGSFFVGDAAGRPAGWKPNAPKDFSDSDILFADAAGISFYTPDEFFLNEPKVQSKLICNSRSYFFKGSPNSTGKHTIMIHTFLSNPLLRL